MRVFYNDYEDGVFTQLDHREIHDKVNSCGEVTLCPVETRVEYSRLNPQDTSLATLLSLLDTTKTVVMHLDSEGDLYIEA